MILPSHNLCQFSRYKIKLLIMKKFFAVLAIALIFSFSTGIAQNRSITFIDKPFAELLSLAKSQDRMIFLDAYTTWCGPCKWMAANMFTNDSVADYYNKTFICAHFDMEKGEGIELARTYQVRAYPTLLFINAAGEMVHKRVGAPQKVGDYLEMGAVALTPGEGFSAYMKRFQEGNRDPKFMVNYLERLQGAYMPITEPLNSYFATQQESDLLSRPNWNIIYRYVTEMDSKEFGFLLHHQKEYSALYTSDSVSSKIFNVYIQALTANIGSRSFSETGYGELQQKIRNSGFEGAEKVIFMGDLSRYQMKGETDKFINLAITGLDNFYSKDYAMLNRMANNFFQITTDTKNLEKAARWAIKSINLKSTSENNDTYANLMYKLGHKAEAIKYEERALEMAKKENVPTKVFESSLKKFRE
jgi:thiol-disulfide isomerase/thioredoxin